MGVLTDPNVTTTVIKKLNFIWSNAHKSTADHLPTNVWCNNLFLLGNFEKKLVHLLHILCSFGRLKLAHLPLLDICGQMISKWWKWPCFLFVSACFWIFFVKILKPQIKKLLFRPKWAKLMSGLTSRFFHEEVKSYFKEK